MSSRLRSGALGMGVVEVVAANSSIIVSDGKGPVTSISTVPWEIGNNSTLIPKLTTATPAAPDAHIGMSLGVIDAGWLRVAIGNFVSADGNNTDGWFRVTFNIIGTLSPTIIPIKTAGSSIPASGVVELEWPGGLFTIATDVARQSGVGTVTFESTVIVVTRINAPSP